MKTAKTITHILFALFIGLIFGGLISGNTIAWVSGLILGILDMLIGTALQYCLDRQDSSANIQYDNKQLSDYMSTFRDDFASSLMQGQITASKVQRLTSNPNLTETFTVAELAMGIVNLADAMMVLSTSEYSYLKKVFDKYQQDLSKVTLTYLEFLSYCEKIISNYDMVAPYYKVCGETGLYSSKIFEDDKIPYREKAKAIIDNGKLFSFEWQSLNQSFYKEFYDI